METFLDGKVVLHAGDCLAVMPELAESSVDAIVTDPPYHLTSIVQRFGAEDAAPAQSGATGVYKRTSAGFMAQRWDGGDVAFRADTWRAALRVLKPGGYLAAFSSTRTYHRMASAIEDAGFGVRDTIFDLVASDAAVGAFMASLTSEQASAFLRCLSEIGFGGILAWIYSTGFPKSHNVAKAAARAATRAGKTADAAAFRGLGTALKPAIEPICLARKPLDGSVLDNVIRHGTGALSIEECRVARSSDDAPPLGRWPANVVSDGSAEVVAAFQQNESSSSFFFSAKAGDDDRLGSDHPTIKPLELMQWLVRLVTPKGGVVLDCFAGTGTAGEAAVREGRRAILIEREAAYRDDIRRRMALVFGGADERARAAIKEKLKGKPPDSGPLFGGSPTDERAKGRRVFGVFGGKHHVSQGDR